jgi:hypothetical protein
MFHTQNEWLYISTPYTPSWHGPRKLYLLCIYLFLGIKYSDWVLFINHVFHSLPLKSDISGSIYPLFKAHLHLIYLFSSYFNITILIFQFPLVFVKFLSFFLTFPVLPPGIVTISAVCTHVPANPRISVVPFAITINTSRHQNVPNVDFISD